jgi:aspartyl protease family protein
MLDHRGQKRRRSRHALASFWVMHGQSAAEIGDFPAMKQVVLAFVFMAAVAYGMVRHLDESKPGNGANAMAMAPKSGAQPAASNGNRTVQLSSDRSGHFQTNVMVDGRAIEFLVDTGASSVALRESEAARLGIRPSARDYNVRTQTANGIGKAARVRLGIVELKGITVRDVEAIVVPDDALSTNLLGMSFLSRVKWTHDRGRLVIEQ